MIDDPLDDLPIEMRPTDDLDSGSTTEQTETALGAAGTVHEPILTKESPVNSSTTPEWFDLFKRPGEAINKLLSKLMGKLFTQPELKIGGSQAPITPLAGYNPQVLGGKRLDFDADLVEVWDTMDLEQPTLELGGIRDPTTPLEGYPPNVAMGKQLDFDYYPIRETVAFDLNDLTVV